MVVVVVGFTVVERFETLEVAGLAVAGVDGFTVVVVLAAGFSVLMVLETPVGAAGRTLEEVDCLASEEDAGRDICC